MEFFCVYNGLSKEEGINMDEKSSNLIKYLGQAYNSPAIKNDLELKRLMGDSAKPLMGNNDDNVYFEVISKLTHGVAKYYQEHHETIPSEINDVYQQIKKDVPAHSVEGKRLLRQFKDDHLAAIL